MKTSCTKCGHPKEEDDFPFRNKKAGIRHKTCKVCHREIKRQDYLLKKPAYKKRNKKGVKKRIEFLIKLRTETPCKDCGKNYPYYMMQFDHVEKKELHVLNAAIISWTVMWAELARCEIVCANCHCERTHNRRVNRLRPRVHP